MGRIEMTLRPNMWYTFDGQQTICGLVIIKNLENFSRRYVTLWPWPLTPWLWTFVVDQKLTSRVQTPYEIWVKLSNPRLSYWRFNYFFKERGMNSQALLHRGSGPNCTKSGEKRALSSPNQTVECEHVNGPFNWQRSSSRQSDRLKKSTTTVHTLSRYMPAGARLAVKQTCMLLRAVMETAMQWVVMSNDVSWHTSMAVPLMYSPMSNQVSH